jgi:drug/metabolite transporter (DMT)-like permease
MKNRTTMIDKHPDAKAQGGAEHRFSPFYLILLLGLTLGWGLNWSVMKVVIRDVPPLSFRGFCLLLGGFGLLLLARLGGQTILPHAEGEAARRHWRRLCWLALTNISGWNALSIYGVSFLPSGRAALLGYTMPIWSMALSVWWLGEKFTLRHLLGLTLGVLGVACMMGMEILHIASVPLGASLMLAAALVWATGIVSLKRFPVALSPMTLSGWILLMGSLPLCVVALILESPDWRMPSLWPLLGLLYNVFIAIMFCYWAWNRIALRLPVAVSSLSSLLIPLVGVLGGMLFLGETPGWAEYLGSAFILGAVAMVIGRK